MFAFFFAIPIFATVEQNLIAPPHSSPSLSPSFQHVAFLTKDMKGNSAMRIFDLESMDTQVFYPLKSNKEQCSVESYQWVSDSEIVILSNAEKGANALHLVQLGSGDVKDVDRKGRRKILSASANDGSFWLVELPEEGKVGECKLTKRSTVDLTQEEVIYSVQAKELDCFLDGNQELRLVRKSGTSDQQDGYFYLNKDSETWKSLKIDSGVKMLGFVSSRSSDLLLAGWLGGSSPELCVYDPLVQSKKTTLFSHAEYGVHEFSTAKFDSRNGNFSGFQFYPESPKVFWANPDYKELQGKIDTLLPGTFNDILNVDWDANRILLLRISPHSPEHLVWVDLDKNSSNLIYVNGGKLKSSDIGVTQMVGIASRDGPTLSAFVTLPRVEDVKNLPLVVLMRNDPFNSLSQWGWNGEANYLASKGYMVLSMNHRQGKGMVGELASGNGSDGLHLMFNDLHDGIQELTSNGLADKNRVAILGSGLGAWAAAQACVENVWDFKAIGCMNGIFDLSEYRASASLKVPLSHTIGFWRADLGGPLSDAELSELSPKQHLDRLAPKIFMSWGNWSFGSFKTHSDQFRKVAKKSGKKVTYYTGDWWGPNVDNKHQIEVYEQFVRFLRKSM